MKPIVNQIRFKKKIGKMNFMELIRTATIYNKGLTIEERAKLFRKNSESSSLSNSH